MAKLPGEVTKDIAVRYKAQRISYGLTYEMLASLSGVRAEAVELFETTGDVELQVLVKITKAFNLIEGFPPYANKQTTPPEPAKPSSHLVTIRKKHRAGVH